MNTRYLVICEGVSECNYLQHLLNMLPSMSQGCLTRR